MLVRTTQVPGALPPEGNRVLTALALGVVSGGMDLPRSSHVDRNARKSAPGHVSVVELRVSEVLTSRQGSRGTRH